MKVMCKYCGAKAFDPYRGLCVSSPHKNHEWVPTYEGLENQGGGEGKGDRRRDEIQEQQSQEQLRLAEEQNAILAEQAETASRLAEDEARHRKEQTKRQQEREEQTLDRKVKNFLVLIRNGDLAEIKEILRDGEFDVNNITFVAPVYFEDSNPATEYLKKYVDIDAVDSTQGNDEGNTMLIRAAIAGDEALADRLLALGANINAQSTSGRTALMMASANGHAGFVKYLLEHNADLELRDSDGNSPLMWAADNAHFAVCQILVEAGFEVDENDSVGCTALNHCLLNMDWMLRYAEDGDPAVEQKKQAYVNIAELLLEKGADVNNKDIEGHTALSLLKKNTTLISNNGPHVPSAEPQEGTNATEKGKWWKFW